MKSFLKALALMLLLQLPSLCVHVWAQTEGSSNQSTVLRELNKALAEQNRVLAEQNQALAEQVDAYDKRIEVLESSIASLQKQEDDSKTVHRSLPFFTVLNFLIAILLFGGVVAYFRRHVHIFRKQVDEHEKVFRLFRNDKERVERVRADLERKLLAKEHELRAEISAMSVALTAVQRMNETKLQAMAEQEASEEGSDLFPGEGYYVAPEQDGEEESSDDEKPKISSDACFASLSTMFIRNEQRLVAVEGGVSITTANKWLDAWERNGWVEKVSRGKYMKTSKGKKVSRTILQTLQE